MQEISLRSTQKEDAPFLTNLLSNPTTLPWFPMSTPIEIADAVRIWIGYSEIGAGLTALFENEPCGFANLYIQSYQKCKHTCLFAIVVKEEMRGKGIGTLLLKQLIELAKTTFQIEILHLEVYEGNPAEAFYRKMGFTQFGKQDHFTKEKGLYKGKILMEKRLIP